MDRSVRDAGREAQPMIQQKTEKPVLRRKHAREPKPGAFFAFLRILGRIFLWLGILTIAGAILYSFYALFQATRSFLPYQEQRMAGFVTMIGFSYILFFFICLLSLGGFLISAGAALKFVGSRKTANPAAADPGGRESPPIADARNEPSAGGGR
jgi:hypothetical protein